MMKHIVFRSNLTLPARKVVVALALAVSLCASGQMVDRYRHLTLKTNAVGWAMAITNVSVEYQFAPRVAVELPVYYSCWDYFSSSTKFRIFGMQPEFKYYLDKEQHWSVGGHVGFGFYNFRWGGDYRYQSHHKRCPMGGMGVDVSYRKTFGKDNRWGLDFSLGLGAYRNERDAYPTTPCTCDENDLSHYVNLRCPCRDPEYKRAIFVGIDKLAVSVTYSFDLNKSLNK